MKKILIVSAFAPPDDLIGAVRIGHWIKYLLLEGHKVFLITANNSRIYPQSSNIDLKHQNLFIHRISFLPRIFNRKETNVINNGPTLNQNDGVLISALKKIKPLLGNIDHYIFWILPAMLRGRNLLKSHDFEFIVSSFSPSSSHLVASFLKKKSPKSMWIADFRDLWSDNPNLKNFLVPFENFIEKRVIRNASKLIVVSDNAKKTLANKYPSKKIEVIENGFDPDEHNGWKKACVGPKYIKDTLLITYTGLINRKHRNPSIIFKAVSNLLSDKVITKDQIAINVYTQNKDTCLSILNESEICNKDVVSIKSYVPRNLSLKIQKESDLLLLLESPDQRGNGNLTGKVFEYLVSGVPILAAGMHENNLAKKLVLNTRTGIYSKNYEDIYKTLSLIINNKKISFYNPDLKKINYFSRVQQVKRLL